MPKGVYMHCGIRAWLQEHDDFLEQLIEVRGLSFSKAMPLLREKFPGKTFTRSGLIGRAHRKGFKSKHKSGGTVGISKPRKVKHQEHMKRVGKPVKELEPVVFKNSANALIRDEGDRGSANSPAGSRKLGLNDPVVIERKKGTLPAIIEEKPLTSVPVAFCESESCMWPTSEDVTCMEVCGAPVEVGAYCARHALVAYRVMPTARRNGTHGKQDAEHTRRIDGAQHRDTLDPDGEWLGRMIMDEVVTAPADEPMLEIPHFLDKAS